MKKIISTILALGLSISFLGTNVNAVEQTITGPEAVGQALEIGPPVITLAANPGETIATQINIRNISNGKLLVTGVVNDFEAAGENGTPKIITDENNESIYSIKKWINSIAPLTLKSKELKTLPVEINIPANASPGGYYGIIRFSSKAPELEDTGVALSASIGSMVMIRVKGDAKEQMSVEDFYVSNGENSPKANIFESTPIFFTQRLKNTGNIYEQPTGQATITDMFGKKIAAININLELTNVLPGSTRKYTESLDKSVIGDKKLFGKYTADLKITYGTNKTVINKTITFWVIPYRLIGLAVISLIAIFVGLRFVIKNYNRHIIKKAEKAKVKTKTKTKK